MQVSIAGGKAHLHHAPPKGVELSTQVGRVCVIHLASEDLISNDEESRRQCYACKNQQSPRITLTSAKSNMLCQSHIVEMPTCCSDMLSLAASSAEAVIRPSDKPSMCGCTPLMKHWQDSMLPGSQLAAPAVLGLQDPAVATADMACMRDSGTRLWGRSGCPRRRCSGPRAPCARRTADAPARTCRPPSSARCRTAEKPSTSHLGPRHSACSNYCQVHDNSLQGAHPRLHSQDYNSLYQCQQDAEQMHTADKAGAVLRAQLR